MFKSSQNWWTCSFSLQYQYTLNVWSRGKHLALFSRESNKKTKLTSFPRDHTLNAWLYTDISDPRSQEHYWTSSWSKTWKKFRPVRDLNLSPLHIYDFYIFPIIIHRFVIYLDFPFNNHLENHAVVFGAQATTAKLCPVGNTFEFDQEHVTKNQPITVLALCRESLST